MGPVTTDTPIRHLQQGGIEMDEPPLNLTGPAHQLVMCRMCAVKLVEAPCIAQRTAFMSKIAFVSSGASCSKGFFSAKLSRAALDMRQILWRMVRPDLYHSCVRESSDHRCPFPWF